MTSPLPPEIEIASADQANLFGKYVRVALLGEGGMGEVWKAWDLELHRWVALKFPRFEGREDLERLRKEAQSAGQLNHPNIAAVHEFSHAQGKHFIAMAFVDGEPLSRVSRSDRKRLVTYVRQAATGVANAHAQGIVHRDIKPDNIMIARDNAHVYVMDFGIARQATATLTSTSTGTPPYMSPEQVQGKHIDGRSDVWSLGATLYELLADRPPFEGASGGDIARKILDEDPAPLRHVDSDLNTIVLKCLEKDPARRYATAQELADDLGRCLKEEAILAHPPSFIYRVRKFTLRRRAVLVALALGLLATASIASYVIPKWITEARARKDNDRRLAEEQQRQLLDLRARERSKLYLDRGQVLRERLMRLVCADVWERDAIHRHGRDAQQQFDLALEAYPNLPEAKLEKAKTLRLEEYLNKAPSVESAIKLTQEAIALSPDYVPAHLELAMLNLETYEILRHISGGKTRPQSGKGAALAIEIEAALKKVEAWSKDVHEVQLARAAMRFVNGETVEAAQALEEYSEASVSDFRGWALAGHAWQDFPGQADKSMYCLSMAIRFGPKLPSFLTLRARAQLQKADALKDNGKLEESQKERGLAVEDLRWALRQDPENQVALVILGMTYYLTQDYDSALENLEKALPLNPQDPFAREYCGKAFADRGELKLKRMDYEGAREDFLAALKRDPSRSDMQYHVARAYALEAKSVAGADREALIGKALAALKNAKTYLNSATNCCGGKHPDGRAHARNDSDLELLRDSSEFRSLVQP